MRPLQAAVDPRLDVALFDDDLRPHQLEAMDVQVDRSSADGATAWQGNIGHAEFGGQWSQRQDRGAHGLDQLIGGDMVIDGSRQHGDRAVALHGGTENFQQLQRGIHILEMRYIAEVDLFIAQQGCKQYRQRRVFGTGDGHVAVQAATTVNLEFVHQKIRSLRRA